MKKLLYKSNRRFYTIWSGMLARAGNGKYYKEVRVSDKWKEFSNFYKDMYETYCKHVEEKSEKNTTLERIDVYGNYEKYNCKWATSKEQANNRKNGNYLTYKGTTKSYAEWARFVGISRQAFAHRIKLGWSTDRLIGSKRSRGKKFIVEIIKDDVLRGKFGTKNRAELLLRLENLIEII